MKKGARVEFTNKDGSVSYGVVSKGGDRKNTVVLDGGKYQVSGHPNCFRETDKPLPKDEPNVMDRYTIVGWHEIEGHGDSRTFTAKICKDGKPVIVVQNDGWGGCNSYHPHSAEGGYGEVKAFLADCKAWVALHGYADMLEPDDFWVEWWQFQRPYGITGKDSVRDMWEHLRHLEK